MRIEICKLGMLQTCTMQSSRLLFRKLLFSTLLANWHAPCISVHWKHAISRQLETGDVLAKKKDRTSGEESRGGVDMAEERKDLDKKAQQERKDAHMADPEKNKKAWQQDATDASGRDWTKPFKYDPSQGV